MHQVIWSDGDLTKSAGTVVYECKDTARWNTAYVAQAEAARVCHRAARAVVMSRTFPAPCKGFTVIGGTVVVDDAGMVPIARILRAGLIQIARLCLTAGERASREAALAKYLLSDDFMVTFATVRAAVAKVQNALADERTGQSQT